MKNKIHFTILIILIIIPTLKSQQGAYFNAYYDNKMYYATAFKDKQYAITSKNG